MPILLIKDRDATHWNPEKDLRGCYKRGDIVEVFDDSRYGRETLPGSGVYVVDPVFIAENPIAPPFYIVKVTGVTLERAKRLMEPDTDPAAPETTVRRRRFRLRADDVPLTVRTALQTDRFVEVTALQIQNYIRNKRTGLDGIPE